jgi:hypothetical protein
MNYTPNEGDVRWSRAKEEERDERQRSMLQENVEPQQHETKKHSSKGGITQQQGRRKRSEQNMRNNVRDTFQLQNGQETQEKVEPKQHENKKHSSKKGRDINKGYVRGSRAKEEERHEKDQLQNEHKI